MAAALSNHAAKAIASCHSLLQAYPEIVRYAIISDDPASPGWAALSGDQRLKVVDENAVYPRAEWHNRYQTMVELSPNRSGWYYQQILKLTAINRAALDLAEDKRTDKTGLLVWDSDTRILRALPFVDSKTRRSYSYFTRNSQERHFPFYQVNAELTGTPIATRQSHSNIVQFAALSATEAVAFANFLGLDSNNGRFADLLAQKIVSAICKVGMRSAALFSEYELIGLFKMLRLASPERRVRFIRTNNRIPSRTQLSLMRCCRIDHFTYEERFGTSVKMGFGYLLAQIALQNVPALEHLRKILTPVPDS